MSSLQDETLARDWLVRMRWGAVMAQLATVLFANVALGFPLPLPAVVGLVGVTAVSNLALALRRPGRDPSEVSGARTALLPAVVLLDLLVLTALLALTGGASNPFSVLYLLHVALAAVLLGPRWTWIVTAGAALGFGALFPFTDPHAMHAGEAMLRAHLFGMWFALAITGAGIAFFVARLARDLRDREAELTRLRRFTEQQERVVALATLAAGAAHELGSPLGVISVAAGEITALTEGTAAEEAQAIQGAVARCRRIIARLTQRAGAGQVEIPIERPVSAVWTQLRKALSDRDALRVDLRPSELRVTAPEVALTEALGCLVQNALQAGEGAVEVWAEHLDHHVVFTVRDQGVGMTPEVLTHAGEPFFTTRPPGSGMGLGLFLARRFVEGLGGDLSIDSVRGEGTRVRLRVPE